MPDNVHAALRRQLRYAQVLHQNDLERGYGQVYLPYALARKYPKADREWAWQYVFPFSKLSKDLHIGLIRRHHRAEYGLQKAVKRAVRTAKINKPTRCIFNEEPVQNLTGFWKPVRFVSPTTLLKKHWRINYGPCGGGPPVGMQANCLKRATTFAPFRNSWVTKMSGRP